jgi:hypothetical protein
MRFIKVTEEIMVNPEFISMVEIRKSGKAQNLVLTVEGRQIIASVDPMELMGELMKSGLETDAKGGQFWAG